MLTVLGGLTEFERELVLARTSNGWTRAKARGVRFGCPPALTSPSAPGSQTVIRVLQRTNQVHRSNGGLEDPNGRRPSGNRLLRSFAGLIAGPVEQSVAGTVFGSSKMGDCRCRLPSNIP